MQHCDLDSSDSLEPGARSVLEQLLSEAEEAKLLRAALRKTSGPQLDGPRLWEGASRLIGIAAGDQGVDEAIARLLAEPDVVAFVIRTEPGRACLAEAVSSGAPRVLEALGDAVHRVAPEIQDALCGEFGQRYSSTGELGGCHRLVGVLPEGHARRAMLDAILDAAVADERVARSLGSEDAVLVVGLAAAKKLGVETAAPLLRGAARHIGACAFGSEVPTTYLATMFRVRVGAPGAEPGLLHALSLRPSVLVHAELSDEERERCWAFARQLGPDRLADALPGLMPALAEPERKAALVDLLARLPTAVAARCAIAAARVFEAGGDVPPVLGEVCEDCAVSALAQDLGPLALALLERAPSDDGRLAHDLMQSLVRRTGRPTAVAQRAAEIGDEHIRGAVFDAAIGRALAGAAHPDDVEAVWGVLTKAYPGASPEETLDRLLELGARSPGSVGGGAVLAWIAVALLPAHPKLTGRGGRLRSRVGDEHAREIAVEVAEWEIEKVSPDVKARRDRRAAAWWDELVRHKRKVAKRKQQAPGR